MGRSLPGTPYPASGTPSLSRVPMWLRRPRPHGANGTDWVITGQKMFTSLAEEARWVFTLTRTNTEVAKHQGLTFFLVPFESPQLSVAPIRTMSGKRTNITFFDGVRVADEWRVGEVDGGWKVMLVALAFERGVVGGVSDIAALYRSALTHVRAALDLEDRPLLVNPAVRQRLARIAIDEEVANLLGARAAWAAAQGVPKQEGAEGKLFGTEAYSARRRGPSRRAGARGALDRRRRGGASRGLGGARLSLRAHPHRGRRYQRDPKEPHRRAHTRTPQTALTGSGPMRAAWAAGLQPITPSWRRRWISPWSSPSTSCNTSPVCSPRVGEGRSATGSTPESRTGLPGTI